VTDKNGSKGLNQFTKDVLYDVLVGWTSKALASAAAALAAAIVALIVTGWEVPAWTLVTVALVVVGLVYLTRRGAGRETNELRPKLGVAEKELDRHESYGSNICSALDTFQKIVARDISMTMGAFIEHGILIPARDVMQANGHPSDLRMSVLLAFEGHFSMAWASGHSVEAKQKYEVPIEETISKLAYEKKVPQVWKDAPSEERGFVRNPRATRGFKSMVSIPILLGGESEGVFNVLTDEKDAFDPADINYLTSLGSIVQLAFGMAVKELRNPESLPPKQARGVGVLAPRTSAGALSPPAPRGSVGSPDSTDGKEVSDE
jgi:GAF domain-containing protein